MSAKLLLLEDDPAIARTVAYALERDGLTVTHSLLVHDARQQLQRARFDLLVLDVGLPDGSGLDLLRDVRNAAPTAALPVLMLSAHGEEIDRVLGLELGADDYLTKPFSPRELAARVKALLRRSLKAVSDVIAFGPLELDFSAQTVRLDGAALELTAFEYRLLEYLVRERARIVTKQELSDYLYPHGEDRDSNVLEVLMGRLRRKLDPEGKLAPIETVRGRGYRFTLG